LYNKPYNKPNPQSRFEKKNKCSILKNIKIPNQKTPQSILSPGFLIKRNFHCDNLSVIHVFLKQYFKAAEKALLPPQCCSEGGTVMDLSIP
jgi:hypothetical protein